MSQQSVSALTNDGQGEVSALDRPLSYTQFPDQWAKGMKGRTASLRDLAERIPKQQAASKGELPFLKLAQFGNARSLRGSLRYNANVLAVTGVEGDHDAGTMQPEEARDRLAAAGIAALIYTTPSHMQEGKGPRWRVLAPLSKPQEPEARAALVARLNGLLKGSLAAESFTLSQAYYAGSVEGQEPVQTFLTEGDCLDARPDLDTGAAWKGGQKGERPTGTPQAIGLSWPIIFDALRAIPNDGNEYGERLDWLRIGAALHAETGGGEDGLAAFHEWSAQHGSYDADATDAAWGSFRSDRPGGVTAWTIIREAKRHGWTNAAVEELRRQKRDEELEAMLDDLEVPDDISPEELAEIAYIARLSDDSPDLAKASLSALFAPASDLAGEPVEPRSWHVADLIPGRTVTILNGDGGTGKSLLALQLAVATACGGEWIGRDVVRPGKALVLSAEDDLPELHRRLSDVCTGEGVELGSLDQLLLRSLAGEGALLAVLDRKTNTLKATELYRALEGAVRVEAPNLLILDTLADLHSGEENNRAHARQFIGMLRHLAIAYNCAVLVLAHPSLTGMSSGTGQSGSTGWNNSVRSRLYLKRIKEDQAEPDPNARVLEVMKSNYSKAGEQIVLTWRRGMFQPVGGIEDGAPKAERVFLKLLGIYTEQKRFVSPNPGATYAPAVFAKHPEAERVTKKAFAAAMENFLKTGAIRLGDHGTPAKPRAHLELGDYEDFPE